MTDPAPTGSQNEAKKQRGTSFPGVVLAALLLLGILLFVAELGARAEQASPNQPIRSIGNFHTQFETKWFKLKDYVAKNGGVDVLLMGNSMVNTGVDPDVLADEYEALTGVRPRIFNFGVEGMDLFTNAELAELLVREVNPQTILFFTEMREYGPQTDTSVPERYKTAAWFQYKLGNPSLEGWFYDHSAAMQYFLPYRNWSRADFPDGILSATYRYRLTTAAGYEPDMGTGKDLDVRPDPNDPAHKPFFDLYANFAPAEESLSAFERLLRLQGSGVRVMVTEMPAYFSFYEYFGGEPVHQDFLDTIASLTTANGGAFLTPIDSELIPLPGRVDNHHLNFKGTQVYSTLLGEQLGTLCAVDGLCLTEGAGS